MDNINKIKYKIIGKKEETSGVATLEFSCASGLPKYCSGQFIDVYFPKINSAQGKSYSLSSAPIENKFSITVKAIGEFSNLLLESKIGDIVLGSLPYGFFYSDREDTHLVMVAGGIGISPFRSILLEELTKNNKRKITLFYSSRTNEDIIFKKELDSWQKKYPNLKIKYFLTRENKIIKDKQKGRITAKDILKEISDIKTVEFLLCGSIAFIRDMRKGLCVVGIPEEKIYTEAFFSH